MSGEAYDPAAFLDALRAAYRTQDDALRERFKRSLPLQDAVVDRWERAKSLGFGEGVSIYNSAIVYGDVTIGRNSWVGPYVVLDGCGGGLSIGEWCSISAGVHIYTHDTIAWALSGGRVAHRHAAVSIGDCCYIGSQSVIAAGVTIGSRSVIAANSFVNQAVAPETIVGGSPARPIGRVVFEGDAPRLVFDGRSRGGGKAS